MIFIILIYTIYFTGFYKFIGAVIIKFLRIVILNWWTGVQKVCTLDFTVGSALWSLSISTG